ncbi:MAG: cell division protein FtsQ/DivIB [Paracoccaceae bacterium]
MRSLNRPRRDPAPSRIAYRLQRLWLTPYFRAIIRFGLPVMAAILAVGWFFNQQANRDAITEKIAEIRRSIEERPEFTVNLMAIDGATDAVSDDIREIVPVDFPVSSFDLDLDGMQARILELDAVARADIRIRQGGILQVEITERIPAAVWRVGRDIELLDARGHRVATVASRTERADLPLLAGVGAELNVPEALAILAAAGPVADRVRGLVRIGERRWDLVLDRNQRIMLPEIDPVAALEQVMALHEAQDLMARDIIAVDMGNAARATLRMAPDAVQDLRRIRKTNFAGVLG